MASPLSVSVSNIINHLKKGIDISEFNSIRELAVFSKKEGMTLSDVASHVRSNNYFKKLGANQDQIETLIADLVNSPEPEKLIDVANQVAHLSRSESIRLEDLEKHVKQKREEKQMLEDEINQRRLILESTDVEIQTINEYNQLKAELMMHHHSPEELDKLLTVLKRF